MNGGEADNLVSTQNVFSFLKSLLGKKTIYVIGYVYKINLRSRKD